MFYVSCVHKRKKNLSGFQGQLELNLVHSLFKSCGICPFKWYKRYLLQCHIEAGVSLEVSCGTQKQKDC